MRTKDVVRGVITLVIIAWGILSYHGTVNADEDGLRRMRVTCYLPTGNRTADGTVPYEGIVAGRREDLGKVAIIYSENMEFIGYFEIRDTGGAKWLKNGTALDVFRDDMDGVREWVKAYGDYCLVKIVEADG